MGDLLNWATFLSIFILAFQYSWTHFLKPWYGDYLRKKGLPEHVVASKSNKATKRLQVFIMLLLILAVVLALGDLVWR